MKEIRRNGWSQSNSKNCDPFELKKSQKSKNTKDIYSNGETSARFVITGSETEPVIVNERPQKRKRVKKKVKGTRNVKVVDVYSIAIIAMRIMGCPITIKQILLVSPVRNLGRYLPRHMKLSSSSCDHMFKFTRTDWRNFFDELRCSLLVTYYHLLKPFTNGIEDLIDNQNIIYVLLTKHIEYLCQVFRLPQDVKTIIKLQSLSTFNQSTIDITTTPILPVIDLYAGALVYISLVTVSFESKSKNEIWIEWLDQFIRSEKDNNKEAESDYLLQMLGDTESKTKSKKIIKRLKRLHSVLDLMFKLKPTNEEGREISSLNLKWNGTYHSFCDEAYNSLFDENQFETFADSIPIQMNLKEMFNPTDKSTKESRSDKRWNIFKRRQPTEEGKAYYDFIIRKCCWIFNSQDYHSNGKKAKLRKIDLESFLPHFELFEIISTILSVKPFQLVTFVAKLIQIKTV